MNRFRLLKLSTHRATAWMLLWICLWMGTGVTLHHTDAAAPGAALGPMGVHRLIAAAPADHCAACEWSQGLQTGTVAFCPLPTPHFALQLRCAAAVRASFQRISHLRSPRAPPASLSA